jgi:hypothetical protein
VVEQITHMSSHDDSLDETLHQSADEEEHSETETEMEDDHPEANQPLVGSQPDSNQPVANTTASNNPPNLPDTDQQSMEQQPLEAGSQPEDTVSQGEAADSPAEVSAQLPADSSDEVELGAEPAEADPDQKTRKARAPKAPPADPVRRSARNRHPPKWWTSGQ